MTTANEAPTQNGNQAALSQTAPLWMYWSVGGVQGVALWLLQHLEATHHWPNVTEAWYQGLRYLSLSLPVAWYLAESGFRTQTTRLGFSIVFGGLFALLGFHAGTQLAPRMAVPAMSDYPVAALVLGFVIIGLVLGFDTAKKQFVYSKLFEFAWRNAILVPVTIVLVGLLWVLLWAGAWLMDLIGLDGLHKLLRWPPFYYFVTFSSFGAAMGLAIDRAEALLALRRFWLSLMAWFLPISLVLALSWALALPFTGLKGLFGSHNAAFYLLWFAALTTTFVNAAFQDGHETPSFRPWILSLLGWGWLVAPIIALLGDYALWLRVEQYGWSASRIWAALVGLLAAAYTLGYALSVLRREPWMRALPATNIVGAFLQVIIITALLSPMADVHKLAVASQVSRLESGAVGVNEFDWKYLRQESGSYGIAALKKLAAVPGTGPEDRLIAQRAMQVLHSPSTVLPTGYENQKQIAATLRTRMTVIPKGTVPKASFFDWLAASHDLNGLGCSVNPTACALWLVDLRGDGQYEAVVLRQEPGTVSATLYADENGRWSRQGFFMGGPKQLTQWEQAVESDQTRTLPPTWPDLNINGRLATIDRVN